MFSLYQFFETIYHKLGLLKNQRREKNISEKNKNVDNIIKYSVLSRFL